MCITNGYTVRGSATNRKNMRMPKKCGKTYGYRRVHNIVSFTLTKYSETYTFGLQSINSNTCDISADLDPAILFYNNGESNPLLYYTYTTYNYAEMSVAKNAGGWYAFDMAVDYDGEYTPVVTTAAEHLTDDYKVYLIPASVVGTTNEVGNINTAISSTKYWLGDVTGNNDKTTNPNNIRIETPTTLSAKSLSKGTYKLVLVAETARTYGTKIGTTDIEFSRMKVSSFTLARTGEPTVDPITMMLDATTWNYDTKEFYNETNYTIDTSATTATVKRVNNGNVNFSIPQGEQLVINFYAEVAGDYELVIYSAEHSDYGLNAEILVNGNPVGKIHNDNNVSEPKDYFYNKGFGKVALKEEGNTITIKGLAPDTIKSGSTEETKRAGNVSFYLNAIKLTPAGEEAVVKGIEIFGDNTKVTAKVKMSDGTELMVLKSHTAAHQIQQAQSRLMRIPTL